MTGIRIHMPVATGPVRAPEACIGEAYPGTEHDHGRRQQSTRQCQPPEPEQTSLWVHPLAYGGQPQQALHVFKHALGLCVGRIGHHEIA